jgi:hypothetical protein
VGRAAFCLYLGLNMTVCAVVFAPWALPRETISGLMGRWAIEGRRAGRVGSVVIDAIYWWEPHHCYITAMLEHELRRALY